MLHIYKASAGSGKTYTLTLEYIKLLLGYRDEQGRYQLYRKSDAQHRRILAVTFTNKATEEMKHRIVFQLDILAHDTEKSPYVDGLMQLFGCTVEQIRGIASETLYVCYTIFLISISARSTVSFNKCFGILPAKLDCRAVLR